MARQSFASKCDTWGYDRTGKSVNVFYNSIIHIPSIVERIRNVTIENNDWRKVMAAFDTPETVFYLDPPYVPETRKSGTYHHELTIDDHADLVKQLLSMQGRAILSGYSHEVYKPLEDAGWTRLEINYTSSAAGHTRHKKAVQESMKRVECLWLHPGIKADVELIEGLGFRVAETGNE